VRESERARGGAAGEERSVALKITESLRRVLARDEAGTSREQERLANERKTAALPSLLHGSFGAPGRAVPKVTPASLRRFAETPVPRRAINLIKDKVASLDWQIRLKRDFSLAEVPEAKARMRALRCALEEPNGTDSFRSLLEQVLEDALVGGYGAIEMELTGEQSPSLL
jgi:hypothetical protein